MPETATRGGWAAGAGWDDDQRVVSVGDTENPASRAGAPEPPDGLAVVLAPSELAAWQPALPPFRLMLRDPRGSSLADEFAPAPLGQGFAHPFEHEFARLLDYHRVRWSYEPTTFCLTRAPDGRPTEQFTPDFYLPDHRLYVELTSMRQRLVTRKHRKVRLLRQVCPNVRVKLLYRRDYLRLLAAHAPPIAGACTPGSVIWDEAAIAERIIELADAVAADAGGVGWGSDARPFARTGSNGPLLVVGVGRGADRIQKALVARLRERDVDCEADRVELVRHRTAGGARWVRLRRAPRASLVGRRVLVVEGAVSTGFSLAYLARWLRRRQAAVEVCALLDRRSARVADVSIRYSGFEAPPELLVGYGLDLRRQYRDLPFIASLPAE